MNLYENTFRFYDLIATDFDNDDLKFYESFVQSKKSKILEIGCGTGRVSIWLATHGYSVMGLDLSEYMLSVFNEKLEQDKYLQSKIEIVHADMSDFCIGESFDLIIAPSKSFQAITDIEKAKSTLICIKKHMLEGSLKKCMSFKTCVFTIFTAWDNYSWRFYNCKHIFTKYSYCCSCP